MTWLVPPTLSGRWVRLEPLEDRHAEGLFEASRDPEIWRHLIIPQPQSVAEMREYIATARVPSFEGPQLPFATINLADGSVAGTTRFMAMVAAHRVLEIGWTWLAPRHQRTAINTECKLLLLRHAFEMLGAQRVQLKTDIRNTKSQAAIERLGAVREGVLRALRIRTDGSPRDTVFYSILRDEWPTVRARLEQALARP